MGEAKPTSASVYYSSLAVLRDVCRAFLIGSQITVVELLEHDVSLSQLIQENMSLNITSLGYALLSLVLGLGFFSTDIKAQSDFYQNHRFTRADTLRGALRAERTCYDVH